MTMTLIGTPNPDPESGQGCREPQPAVAALGPILADPSIGIAADIVDDLEKVRTAECNRLRTLTDTSERGHGMSELDSNVIALTALVDAIENLEKDAIKHLEKSMRAHALWPWAKPITGLGAKQFGRLLQSIRDPYWNDLHNRPRTVSELWAYCGYHVIDGGAPRRRRGEKANWNDIARKRCFLIAESLVKEGGRTWPMPDGSPIASRPYRALYESIRDKYADAVHAHDCVRCGPAGKPALAGSPLSMGHQRARAIRAVAKELLKDLWIESKRIHEATAAAIGVVKPKGRSPLRSTTTEATAAARDRTNPKEASPLRSTTTETTAAAMALTNSNPASPLRSKPTELTGTRAVKTTRKTKTTAAARMGTNPIALSPLRSKPTINKKATA